LRLVLHREIPEGETLRAQWNDLVQHMEPPEVFYTYEWARAVNFAYGASLAPLLFLAYEGESLIGCAALATHGPQQDGCFLAGTTADYCDFVSTSALRAEFLHAVFAELRKLGIRNLALANLPADSATVPVLRKAAGKHGYALFSRPAYLCAQIVLGSSPEARQALGKDALKRKVIRYSLNALARQGAVAVEHLKESCQIQLVMPAFVKAHVARFLATGRISNLARPERQAFLARLTDLLSGTGGIVLSRMLVADQPVAWNFGFCFSGSWFYYQPTFNSRLQQFSPGVCLLAKILESACNDPQIRLVDLGLGAEGYKERFATDARQTLHVTIEASRFALIRERMRFWMAALVKSNPRVEREVRRLLAWLSSALNFIRRKRLLDIVHSVCSRATTIFYRKDELVFLEGPGITESRTDSPPRLPLQPLDLDLLAETALRYFDDPEMMDYLPKAAARLRSKDEKGFALIASDGVPVEFCWAKDFEKLYIPQLGRILGAPAPEAVILFDAKSLGASAQDFSVQTLVEASLHLRASGKIPWIFSPAGDTAHLETLEKAGFVRQFRVERKRILFVGRVRRVPARNDSARSSRHSPT
jgi:CelD/BcsL family acetyltransferase involved in cellulose biosynthesis